MPGRRLLPWEYGIRNLFRRPGRSALTLAALTLVVLLVFVVIAFIRGLEASRSVSGDPRVVLVHSLGASENIENSSILGRTTAVLAASLEAVQRRMGPDAVPLAYASPELYLGTEVAAEGDEEASLGLVRGVTPAVLLVRRRVQVLEGRWPGPGEVLVGRLAGTKLGRGADALAVGRRVRFEGRSWRVSGRFAALGSALESEVWCPLDDLQQAMKRQDLSVVALPLAPGASFGDIDEFCKERLDLELQTTPETAYYRSLHKHYSPVRAPAWVVVFLVTGGLLGVGAALATLSWSALAVGTEGVTVAFTPSASLALMGLLVTAAVGITASLVPAWQASRADIVASLRCV